MYLNESGFYVANEEAKAYDEAIYNAYDSLAGELDATKYLIRLLKAQADKCPEEAKEAIKKQLKELRKTRDIITREMNL